MLSQVKTWTERLRDAIIYAIVLVVLLLGASAVTQGPTNDAVRRIADASERSAIAAEINARLQAAIACVLQLDHGDRAANAGKCYARMGLPFPFDYELAEEVISHR